MLPSHFRKIKQQIDEPVTSFKGVCTHGSKLNLGLDNYSILPMSNTSKEYCLGLWPSPRLLLLVLSKPAGAKNFSCLGLCGRDICPKS